MFKETILPALLILASILAVAVLGTLLSVHNLSVDCSKSGGHMVREGGTVWCRH